ncbi:MAG: Nif11-like leader peptide family natural product precursor [Bacteroidales bacterium]|nr:Nif11-like leader peptide family natural product precursor [Bacteroidales bacterium]MBN2818007.1 Nif11-like leader peptide family natural product precursor [Bacteroidales bacterium]
MSIVNAQKFLEKIQTDNEFRKEVTHTKELNKFEEILKNKNMNFSSSEMEEGFNTLHVSCQSYEQAEDLKNAYLFYQLLISSIS